MTSLAPTVWLPLFVLFYVAVMLYWARVAVMRGRGGDGFFSAGHDLAPWIGALVVAGSGLTGWFLLGGTRQIAAEGFQTPGLMIAGIAIALPGVLFFKRLWFVAERMRVSSQADIFRLYFHSPFLVVVTTAVAVLFAIGLAGLQVRALSQMTEALTGGAVPQLLASVVFGFMLFAGTGIGGMRAIGYFGVVQTVLAFAAIIVLAAFVLLFLGGFGGLNSGLLRLATTPDTASLFLVDGVVRFTAGLGRGGDPANAQTALASFSLALAFMGFQCSPLAIKIVLSTRSPGGIAAGQTWVSAGFFGALVVFAVVAIGAAGLLDPGLTIGSLFERLQVESPWFAAWTFVGALAGVQLLAGLGLFTAAEGLVRHVYRPYFNSELSKEATVTLTRIAIAVLAVLAMAMQNLTPVTLSALASVTLSVSFQLFTPLLGVTWIGWFTRQAVVTGVGFGIAGVILTEPLGYQVLSFFGLELPWGRWPWTIHSALWGMAANLAATLVVSAVTNRSSPSAEAREIRRLFLGPLASSPKARGLRTTAWSAALLWLFMAAGPGLIFGNHAFAVTEGDSQTWLLGMPSIWAWALVGWLSGVGLVWFLGYRMEMASRVQVTIPPYRPPPRLEKDKSQVERQRLAMLLVTGAAAFVLAVLVAFGFGG